MFDKMTHFSIAPARAILDGLGSPDTKLKIIHIAGTNGKGSTARFFTEILIADGKKVGTFTSPQVYSYCDQFEIDGKQIPEELFKKYRAEAEKFAQGASGFEIDTATAISAFYSEGCEYAVIECGMGGLNDATNAILKKELAIITSISLEHTEYLGRTIEEICAQKAGIIKNCPAIVNAHQSDGVKEFFKDCIFADKVEKIFSDGFVYDGRKFALSAKGCLQPYNASCAIEGARLLGISERAIYEGIKNCKPRGRLEKLSIGNKTYILDGAHNPGAFEPLKSYLKENTARRTIIFGALGDKDIDGNLKGLPGDEIIAVKCPSPRTRSAEDTEMHCRKFFKNVKRAQSVSEALEIADCDEVVVCGSFTLLKEALEWIEKRQ